MGDGTGTNGFDINMGDGNGTKDGYNNDMGDGAYKSNKYRIIIILVGINIILFNFLIILINNFILN